MHDFVCPLYRRFVLASINYEKSLLFILFFGSVFALLKPLWKNMANAEAALASNKFFFMKFQQIQASFFIGFVTAVIQVIHFEFINIMLWIEHTRNVLTFCTSLMMPELFINIYTYFWMSEMI